MNENPYRSPRDADPSEDNRSLLKAIAPTRKAHDRWSRNCWIIGGLCVAGAIVGSMFAQGLHAEHHMETLANALAVAAMGLFLIGFVVIAIGPISWFWFRRRGK